MPEGWADDPARRQVAGVPENTLFATQPQPGRQMLACAFAAGVPVGERRERVWRR